MTKAESLAVLHTWAHGTLRDERIRKVDLIEGSIAMEHGLAAVRAIQAVQTPTDCPHVQSGAIFLRLQTPTGEIVKRCFDCWTTHPSMIASREARLAVRAALDAVGLKTL